MIWRAVWLLAVERNGEAIEPSELEGPLSGKRQKRASKKKVLPTRDRVAFGVSRTGRQGLLELLGLLGVLEHQGVQVLLAANLELDVLGLLVLLDARGCSIRSAIVLLNHTSIALVIDSRRQVRRSGFPVCKNVQEASFRRQISMN